MKIRKYMNLKKTIFLAVILVFAACGGKEKRGYDRYDYPGILDISYTPDEQVRCGGWFTDAGSWWGFTPPQKGNFVNGFCGPFHLDMNRRVWFSDAIVKAGFAKEASGALFSPDSTAYYPGELYMKASSGNGSIEQSMIFLDKNNVLLCVKGDDVLMFGGTVSWGSKLYNDRLLTMELVNNSVVVKDTTGEGFLLTFGNGAEVSLTKEPETEAWSAGYTAVCSEKNADVLISFFMPGDEIEDVLSGAAGVYGERSRLKAANLERWNGYFRSVIREDMPSEYNRIAAKAVTTLVANWRSPRGDLLHAGVVPSHAAGYFVGFWGWDSWKHAVALSRFAPELAKDQVRAMFDYQDEDGMVIDCIYSDKRENNARDSKPPLAAWAVSEIYKTTGDSAFVKEMYPKMLKYFKWWYRFRDHNGNGVCEFGSCDGTLEAAAWESGMDNAVRFDDAVMVYNGKKNKAGRPADDGKGGWSMNRESVDLNAFLAYEHRLLGELAGVAGAEISAGNGRDAPVVGKPYPVDVADYFFSRDHGFFFDRKFDSIFVVQEGTEACIPLWAGIATQKQADEVFLIFGNPNKFATYIPFPTIAADNPKFTPDGYWRGPIWLDQVYFGINGLRKYGYIKEADDFTRNVFDRLYGLKEGAPVHENYNTHNGSLLKAPHFSWSSAHLLMLYEEFGKGIANI